MATANTPIYEIPYPRSTDPVNVAGDIEVLANRIEAILPSLETPNQQVTVENNTLELINIGDPVFVTGYAGRDDISDVAYIAKAKANTPSTMPAVGIAITQMNPGARGSMAINGQIESFINTSGTVVGDVLYVGLNGGLTKTVPTYPNYAQRIAVVLRSDAVEGKVFMFADNQPGVMTWGQLKLRS